MSPGECKPLSSTMYYNLSTEIKIMANSAPKLNTFVAHSPSCHQVY